MKRIELVYFITFFALVLVLSSCSTDSPTAPPVTNNNDSCGSSQQKQATFVALDYAIPSTYMLASERYYNFFIFIDSICTDKHVTASFYASGYDTTGRQIRFSSAIEWQLLWEKTDTGATEHHSTGTFEWLSTIEDLGLKVPFGENAASVYSNIYVHFPTLGTAALDSAFLRRKVVTLIFNFNYSYHKPRTSRPESSIGLSSMPVIANGRREDFYEVPLQFGKERALFPPSRGLF